MKTEKLVNRNRKMVSAAAGIFSEIDIHFALFIDRYSQSEALSVFLAAALVSRATGRGDICLNLDSAAETQLIEKQTGTDAVICPPLSRWLDQLDAHPAVGKPGEKCPLILDARHRLYLYRYWEYENRLAADLRRRAKGVAQDFRTKGLRATLKRLFPGAAGQTVDWQQIAALVSVCKRFSVITGGPGSGKTFTIARILALLLECVQLERMRICLAAPTGKAAARLAESITAAKASLNCRNAVKNDIPDEVYTIHRLLKPMGGTPYFRHNSENPLPADVVIVDEASMVDLALMSKLVQALAPETRLLLIGDKDQLASVEAGSVLGDICDRQVIHGFSREFLTRVEDLSGIRLPDTVGSVSGADDLRDCVSTLQQSYRFKPQSGIGALSRSVNHGDGDAALAILSRTTDDSLAWHDTRVGNDPARDLKRLIIEGYRNYVTLQDPVSAMDEFSRFQILCALKIGPLGSININKLAEQLLSREGLLPGIRGAAPLWYRGRPILVTRNDYHLGLLNGDIGLTLPDPASVDDELYVWFRDASGEFIRFPTHRLGEHETVFAMTVHKSQGSEFDHAVLLLPERDYPLLTRELIYTALTRARQKVSIWGPETVLRTAISRKIDRTSGLRDALWS